MDTAFLSSIEPSRDNLLVALRSELNDDVILEMAKSDVPIREEVAANRESLVAIRDSGIVPGKLDWNPAEVCNLLRWEHDAPEHETSLMSLFGCWILLCAYAQPESLESGSVEDGDEHTIAGLCENATRLGMDFVEPSAEFLYWAYLSFESVPEHRHEARPFYLFGLLCMASLRDGLLTFDELMVIEERLYEEENRVRTYMASDEFCNVYTDQPQFPIWLLGLSAPDLNNFYDRCRKLIRRAIKAQASFGNSKEKAELRKILLKLWGDRNTA